MNNQSIIMATGVFVVAFLVFGLLEILENPVIMGLMIAGYLGILIKIILVISKSQSSNEKTTPKRGS